MELILELNSDEEFGKLKQGEGAFATLVEDV